MVSKRICARASSRDIPLVKSLIERCIQSYMTQKEAMDALHAQLEIEPAITELVWQKLEEDNREFFQAYYQRLMLKQQILEFNKLLEQQARLMEQINSTGVSSISNSNEPQMPLVPKSTSCYALQNTGPALKQEDMHHPMISSLPNVVTNGGSSRGGGQRRGEDLVHPLKVYLEDLYLGTSKKLSLPRNVICSKCNGKGSKSGTSLRCPGCQGKVSIRHLGPSMIQQMQHPCNDCKGTGEMINDEDRCPQCKGEKVVQEKKVLEVIVEKGMQNGQKITFPGEADEAPDTITGDIVFVLQQQDHPKFKRKGEDLFVEHTLSLTEALCGFHFVVTHLDGRQLLIKSNPGEFAKPDSFKAINNEGMPLYQKPFMKGKLYIHFTVEFPDSLNPDQIKALEVILPPKSTSQLTDMELDECEETTLHDVKHRRGDEGEAADSKGQEAEEMHDVKRRRGDEGEAAGSKGQEAEEMHGGPQRVQCAQQ